MINKYYLKGVKPDLTIKWLFEKYNMKEEIKKPYCKVRWKEQKVNIICGGNLPCPEHPIPKRFTNNAGLMRRYEKGEVSQDWMNGYNEAIKDFKKELKELG